MNQSLFLLRLDGVARYLVSGGDRITIEAAAQADPDSVKLFLLGSAFGALLHQRSLIPLHASAIETAHGAVLLAGLSGVGKSTLAAAFYKRGYHVIADEICALHGNFVHAAMSRLLLWPDVVDQLGLHSEAVRLARPNLKKLHVPIKTPLIGNPHPVHRIYTLHATNTGDFNLSRLSGIEKLQALIDCTFRRQFLWGMDSAAGYMERMTAAARSIPVSRLVRSRSRKFHEVADLLERDFNR